MNDAPEQYDEKPKEGSGEKSRADFVKYWLDALAAASKCEEDWRKEGDDAVKVFRGDKEADKAFPRAREFNIFHANVKTTIPAIYNSTPVPDVRRRFGDKDKVAKTVSQIIERCLSFSVDNYDFDETMRQTLFDGLVPGRGVARVRYIPYFSEPAEMGTQPETLEHEQDEKQIDPAGDGEPGEQLTYEEVSCEYVPWKRFRVGPADEWAQVPWVAFEHYLTRKEIEKLAGKGVDAKAVQLDCRVNGEPDTGEDDQPGSDTLKRGRVWEIWDRSERKVIFIATGYPYKPLREEDDPLGLQGFFPVPRPVQPILTPGDLTPVCPYTVYRSLVEELGEVTHRIKALVKQLRVRGGYAGGGQDLANMMSADDGELVALEGLEAMITSGGDLSKVIAWWPIEPTVKALAQLYQQREQIKQTIYEVTGLSDIVRGASKASETATAQEIKQQWGSLRIQEMQQDVQRFARDLFRLKAEIISTKFSPQTVMMIAGIKLLPEQAKAMLQQQMAMAQQGGPQPQIDDETRRALEAPSQEAVFGVMQSDVMRSYKVDVESDSTIRADLTRNQQAMAGFLDGTAKYIAAVGPAVQSGQMPPEAAVEVYSSFARNFKLGKQAEDALDKMSEGASRPQPQKPDPEAEKMKAQMALEEKKAAIQQQSDQAKLQLEAQKMQLQAQNDQAKAQNDMAIAQQKMQFDMELEREKAANAYNIELMKAQADIEIKRELAAQQSQIAREQSQGKMIIAADEAQAKAKMQREAMRQ